MYCPQCGQQQVSEVVRFCSRCGFLLEGTAVVVASGGMVPAGYIKPGGQKLSPRSKGVRQGALLMLSTFLLVPIVAILSVNLFYDVSHIIIPLTAIFCFVGGLLRMLYALMMEDAYPQMDNEQVGGYQSPATPQFGDPVRSAALPPASANAATSWRQRPNTAEIYRPPSITENTTRLLDREEPKDR